jgi:hypothetical protein
MRAVPALLPLVACGGPTLIDGILLPDVDAATLTRFER